MAQRKLAAVVLGAGRGTRMNSGLAKVLHPLAGHPMIGHVLDTLRELAPERIAVVVAPGMQDVVRATAPHACVVQEKPLGTGDAVKAARQALAGFSGDLLIVYADTPLVTGGTLKRLLAARARVPIPAIAVLGMRLADGGNYGRLVIDRNGMLERIVEARDATAAERKIQLCNSGFMAADADLLFDLLGGLTNNNAKKEYYLTDAVGLARARNQPCVAIEGRADELMGVNSRTELAVAESIYQSRRRAAAIESGVTLIGPETVFFSYDTKLGPNVTAGPFVVFASGVAVEEGAQIRAFSHLERAHIGRNAVIGPFARLRPGTQISEGAHVGNFVEIKNAVLGAGAKANHLSYIGDANVGAAANIGAGTITCNFDGFQKAMTEIGRSAFIGSNTALVAPVRIGERAVVGAGSVITHDVPDDALSIGRGDQTDRVGGAARYRARKGGAKAPAKPKAQPKTKPKATAKKKPKRAGRKG